MHGPRVRGCDDHRDGARVPGRHRCRLDLRRVAGLRCRNGDLERDTSRSGDPVVENRLRERRAASGWSQAHLADLVGVSRQTVNALEKGRYDPSLPLAFRLARVFSTTIEDLFEPSDEDLGRTAAASAGRG
ncbi:MAG: helix-turn-helix transcriptional regulator [Microthrixaceae bacterium]|nr:helix-turn-helix transcriptional regulator [Microthrixaceae bacterium]